MMVTDGRFYSQITGITPEGNDKYSYELKQSIEETGELCLANLNNEVSRPIMLLGSIQSGKTRAFIGLMSLCFDNDFDMTIILTKCSKALVKQTVSRMTAEFDHFRTGQGTVGDVIAQDILDIDFSGKAYMEEKESVVSQFLRKYRGKKRIIVVKKQADNVDRMNMFIEQLVKQGLYKRILIVDDEADITSVGYEKKSSQRDEISLRRISGAINTTRKQLNSTIEHVLVQVTATPYALYLQPEYFADKNIMPVKPARTVVIPTGKGYIGGEYYFISSEDKSSNNYDRAKYLPVIVGQGEMSILNGATKNSGKNPSITDGRTVRMSEFIANQSIKSTFALPSMRSWLFDVLVGTAIIQLNPEYEGFYTAAVLHAAIAKNVHKKEKEVLEKAINILRETLETDIEDSDVRYFVKESYEKMQESVEAYGVLQMPALNEVASKIGMMNEWGELEGLITEIQIQEVNSDNDIERILNSVTGELKLETAITIFVGGQVLDRGITIPNMISFFYGRDPETMQQDTVMQHCRMFGYRSRQLLSVTRFYTTNRLFNNMKEITIRDSILRKRMLLQQDCSVVYLEAGGKIKACSPQKVLASNIHSILPDKRYLPVGFDIDKQEAKKKTVAVDKILYDIGAMLLSPNNKYKKGESTDDKYIIIDFDTAKILLEHAYGSMIPKEDGLCNEFAEMESILLFSLSERMSKGTDEIALVVRTGRELGRMKYGGKAYQDAPDDGNNEGALARILREKMPVLLMIEETNKEWGARFWWPVYFTHSDMNIGIYSEELQRTGVSENVYSMGKCPIVIEEFRLIDNIGLTSDEIDSFNQNIDEVVDYFIEQFEMDDCVKCEKQRKSVICNVYIEQDDMLGSEEDFIARIRLIKIRAKRILTEAEVEENVINNFVKYFDMVLEDEVTDEIRDAQMQMIEDFELKPMKKRLLVQCICETDELITRSREILGYFMPTGSGRCEIHLYYGAMEACCKEEKYDEKAVYDMCKYVMAHEIYHAMHYTDVMTQSGRWLYTKKAYYKQGAVQETLAEYFALCYAKDVLDARETNMDVVEYIRKIRNIKEFPKDGGYSGALILERGEKDDERGNKSNLYYQIYKTALDDMPKAYEIVEAQWKK